MDEMAEQGIAESTKRKNIIDMAITFTAMMRVFAKGSKSKIAAKLEEIFSNLSSINNLEQYQHVHDSFCQWFIREIYTAKKTFKNGRVKQSKCASYGQAAKTFDIAIKVYVYYCGQPSSIVSHRLVPLLNGAVDTPIMKYLTSEYPDHQITATTIEEVDKSAYQELQSLIKKDIEIKFKNRIKPVQYDDITWYELNRAKQISPADGVKRLR